MEDKRMSKKEGKSQEREEGAQPTVRIGSSGRPIKGETRGSILVDLGLLLDYCASKIDTICPPKSKLKFKNCVRLRLVQHWWTPQTPLCCPA